MNELRVNERVSPNRTREKVRELTVDNVLSTSVTNQNETFLPAIQALVVDGLLSFGDRTAFNFGKLNLLVGPNGAGKSNLFDCIRVLRSTPLSVQEVFRDSGFEDWLYKGSDNPRSRGFLEAKINHPKIPDGISHKLRFVNGTHSQVLLEEEIASARASINPQQYFAGSYRSGATLTTPTSKNRRRTRQLGNDEYSANASILSQIRDVSQYPEITQLAQLYSDFRIYSEWTFGRNSKLRESAPTNRTDTRLSERMDDLPLALNGLEETTAHETIKRLLGELKETYADYVTRIIFGRVGLELTDASLTNPLPAKRLSDGTLRFLALAAILCQPDPPSVICLEEPELGMHPDMIRIVARMIVDAAEHTQVFVTTHSDYLLTALQDDFDTLIAFDAGISGSLIRQFSQEEFKQWSEEHTLGELWSSGELGGTRW